MPVEQSSFEPVRALLIALLSMGLAIGFLVVVLVSLNRTDALEIKLGDETFEAGDPDKIAEVVDEGGPILYQALVGNRDIYVQHLGETANDGWFAFDAVRPGQPRECFLEYQPELFQFVDTCDGTVVPEFGGDQPSYPVIIDNDLLFVDLNAALREAETDGDG